LVKKTKTFDLSLYGGFRGDLKSIAVNTESAAAISSRRYIAEVEE
jgi:hypothetical protein